MASHRPSRTRSGGRRNPRSAASAKRPGINASPTFLITLGLLFALPVFFTPTQLLEGFEFPKASLLVTGALVLAAWWIAAESSRLGATGLAGWLRALPGRIVASARRDPLGAAVGLMLISATASTITSIRPALSLFGAPQSSAGLKTVAALAAIYYASRSLASNTAWIRLIAQASGAAASVAVGYALLQVAHLDPVIWQRQIAFEGLIRSGSTVGHPNTLSAYLTMCLPLFVWLATRGRSRAVTIAWLVLAAVSLFVIVASLSRGAWLGLAAAVLTALIFALGSGARPARRWVLIVLAIVVLVLAVPLLTPMKDALLMRLHQLTDFSAETSRTRIELWRAGLRMFAHHPLLGVGLDGYIAAFPPYRTMTLTRIEWGGTPAKAHNDAVQILATQGLLGALAALAIVILAALALWHTARRGNPETRIAAIAGAAALAGYVASSLVGFGTVATSALAAALAGWAARASPVAEVHAAPAPREGPPVRSFWNLAAGVALAGALWFLLVGKPLRAEILVAQGMHYPGGSPQRDDLLARAASTAPWDPRYSAELGRSLFYEALRERDPETRLDLMARARAALEKSVRAAPENGENRLLFATVVSGQAALRPGAISKGEVREAFRAAVALDPLSPVVLVGAERGLLAASLDEDARELAIRCATAYPDYAPPLADLGAIALEQGRNADAADTLKLALQRVWREDVTGAANAWNDLASASLALGRNEEAAAAADSALAHNPNLGQAFGIKEAAKRAISQKGVAGRRGK